MQNQKRTPTSQNNDKLDQILNQDRPELVALWLGYFSQSPPKGLSQAIIRSILAYEVQARQNKIANQDINQKLRATHKQQGKPAQNQPSLSGDHLSPIKLKQGSQILREWNGVTHKVEVVEEGYHWQNKTYKSLSAIAKAITGAHWSGPRFFGLTKRNLIEEKQTRISRTPIANKQTTKIKQHASGATIAQNSNQLSKQVADPIAGEA